MAKAKTVTEVSTPAGARLLGICPAQFRRLMADRKIQPVRYYTNPHYRSGPECPMWPAPSVRRLAGAKAVAAIQERSRRLRDARAAAPARRRQALARRFPDPRRAVPAAAEALFQLNRYAKHRRCAWEHQQEIYSLKNRFVELLCALGHCTGAREHVSDRPVRACWCTVDEYGVCTKCGRADGDDGAGRETLVAFRFVVEGKAYCWHQPEDLVMWDYEVTDAAEAWQGERDEKPVALPARQFAQARALIAFVVDSFTGNTSSKE
jgi:hypothetical protein